MSERSDGWRDRVIPGVLDVSERLDIERRFGVGPDQVVRDHIISHALSAIASAAADDVIFFGGTALSRTHLTELRLSEDIDLIALGDRRAIGARIESAITSRLQRTLGAVVFTPRLQDTHEADPAVVQVGESRVQVQLLSALGYPAWPAEIVEVDQRYSDAPPARLKVLTRPAFVASKLAAWSDRAASRDLYDLWAMERAGMIDADAVTLFGAMGPYTSAAAVSFAAVPSDDDWTTTLAHQGLVRVGPRDAGDAVRRAVRRVLSS